MHGEDVAATIEPEEIPLSIICPASSTTMRVLASHANSQPRRARLARSEG